MIYVYRFIIRVLVLCEARPLVIMRTIEHFVQRKNIIALCCDEQGIIGIQKFENQLVVERMMIQRMDIHSLLQSKDSILFGKELYWITKDIYIRFKLYNVFGAHGAQYVEARLYKHLRSSDFQCLSQYHFVYPKQKTRQ